MKGRTIGLTLMSVPANARRGEWIEGVEQWRLNYSLDTRVPDGRAEGLRSGILRNLHHGNSKSTDVPKHWHS